MLIFLSENLRYGDHSVFQQEEEGNNEQKCDPDNPEDMVVGKHAGLPLDGAVENGQSRFLGGDGIEAPGDGCLLEFRQAKLGGRIVFALDFSAITAKKRANTLLCAVALRRARARFAPTENSFSRLAERVFQNVPELSFREDGRHDAHADPQQVFRVA